MTEREMCKYKKMDRQTERKTNRQRVTDKHRDTQAETDTQKDRHRQRQVGRGWGWEGGVVVVKTFTDSDHVLGRECPNTSHPRGIATHHLVRHSRPDP